MSQTRPIWNDGQGLATPDLQRPSDLVGSVDDRVFEIYNTPGSVAKKILPLSEESATLNPRMLAIPSTPALSPAGTNGAVRVLPCQLMAGSPTSTQQMSLAGTLYSALDSVVITSNSSGSTRYDLIYLTLNRAVTVTGTRRIKSATDGSLSSVSVNLADAPSISVGVNVGFLTGATAPTAAQIAAALPADTAPSSSTFGSFNFAICYVTVPNGYTSGTALTASNIQQTWNGGFIHTHRVRGLRAATGFYTGTANERPGSTLSDRWGSAQSLFVHFKLVSATAIGTVNTVIDNSIDWRRRIVWGWYFYLGSGSILPLETNTTLNPTMPWSNTAGTNWGPLPAMIEFNTGIGINQSVQYGASANNLLFVSITNAGDLRIGRGSSLIDATNGDAFALVLYATDQFTNGV